MDLYNSYIEKYKTIIDNNDAIKLNGKVSDVIGLVIVSTGPNVSLGEICKVVNRFGEEVCDNEIVGFKDGKGLSIGLGEVKKFRQDVKLLQREEVLN